MNNIFEDVKFFLRRTWIGSLLLNLDWKLNFSVLFIMVAGLITLVSANQELFQKQIWWWIIGLILFFLLVIFDWRPFINYRGIILGLYLLMIALLVATFFLAPTIRGTKSWLQIGSFQLQASEFMKIALIILYAQFFRKRHTQIRRVMNIIVSFIYFIIPALLIVLQPDFGSVLILFAIWGGFLLVSGIRWRHLIITAIIFSVLGGLMWHSVLEDYQKQRIIGLFSPERDPLGINYNVIQSKIAIGSAGWLGKGFSQGSQVQLGFLPEAQTDFIFAAFIEEWGLLAGILLLIAFSFLIFRVIRIGVESDSNFGRFLCLGTAILFITQFFLNVGSNIGLTPVIGVTFPLFSYGGSSLLTNLFLLGMIQAIYSRKAL